MLVLLGTHVLLHLLIEGPAIRMPEHHARRFFLHVEQAQLLADLAVIPLFGFFQAMQVGLEVFLVTPGGTVDALQLLIAGIATPIGAGHLGQLEGLQLAGAGHVGATAQIDEIALTIKRKIFLTGNILDDANLVLFAHLVEQLDRLVPGHNGTGYRQILLGQLFHALLDTRHVFVGKRALILEVVVEAVLNYRADGDLGTRKQLLNRHGHQVGSGVANDIHAVFVTLRHDCQLCIVFNQVTGIYKLSVNLSGQGRFGQACANVCGNVVYGYGFGKTAMTAIWQGNDGHDDLLMVSQR